MAKIRKIPLRICISCREQKAKKELLRVVRTPEGEILFDRSGKKAGRGAYICATRKCLKAAAKGAKLEKQLRQPLPPGFIDAIAAELPEDEGV